jgi:hypothetical protein
MALANIALALVAIILGVAIYRRWRSAFRAVPACGTHVPCLMSVGACNQLPESLDKKACLNAVAHCQGGFSLGCAKAITRIRPDAGAQLVQLTGICAPASIDYNEAYKRAQAEALMLPYTMKVLGKTAAC